MKENKCGTCRFFKWDGQAERGYDGVCRRFPPPSTGESVDVSALDWCGEHQLSAGAFKEAMAALGVG